MYREKLRECGRTLGANDHKVFEAWQAQLMKIATGVEYPTTSRFILPLETLYYIIAKSQDKYDLAIAAYRGLFISRE